jgi:hypothetical protein
MYVVVENVENLDAVRARARARVFLVALRVRFLICSGGAKLRPLVVYLYDKHEAQTLGHN